MARTFPLASTGSEEEKSRVRRVIQQRGLSGAANDSKWAVLLDAMRTREGWTPSYRWKCVDGPISAWETEWHYHLPFPMMSVEWFDMGTRQEINCGMLLAPESIDHSPWIVEILKRAKFEYEHVGDMIRIFGYLPKSYEQFEPH